MEFILIVLSSILFTIPHYLPSLFFLSYFAFIPLIYLIKDYDYRHSFIIALLIGFLNSVFSLYWLYQPLNTVLKMPFSFNLFILLVYFLISALPFAIWALFNKFLQPERSYSPFIAALSWTGLEYLRFEFFNLNPFDYFAYTQSSFSLLTQYASYGGIFLVSFISVLIASYLVKLYFEAKWKKAVPMLVIIIILIIIPLVDNSNPDFQKFNQKADLTVINSQAESNNFEKIEEEINNLNSLVEKSKSKYIFTPLKSLSFDLIRNNYYREKLKSKLKADLENSYLQLGSQAAVKKSYNSKIFDSLFLITGDLEIKNRSNKNRNILSAVNFPYKKRFKKLLVEHLNFDNQLMKSLESKEIIELEELSYLNLFSDEIFIPLVSRKNDEAQNINLIVNSAAEGQINSKVYSNLSLAAAVYRAAESNTDLIRTVSSGHSAYINENGKILVKKDLTNNSKTLNLVLQQKQSYYQKNPEKIMNIIITILLIISLIKIIIVAKNKLSSRN